MIQSVDLAVLRWILSLPHPPLLVYVMSAVSILGISGAVWVGIAFVHASHGSGKALMCAWRVVTAVWLALIVANWILKPALDRPRPFVTDPALVVTGAYLPNSPSFPSGHAASAVAGAFALSIMWPQRRRWFWALAVLMVFSRLYLGVHYPTDVLVGAVTGWACAVFATARTPCYISGSLPRSA
jgi:undecaprenyl-diphosphatase